MSDMNKIKDLIKQVDASGVEAKDLISAFLKKNKIDIMDLFGPQQINRYLEIQSLVDEMMSEDGLKVDMDCEKYGDINIMDCLAGDSTIEFLRENSLLVKYELKRRGVEGIGYISNRISGIFTLQADIDGDDIISVWEPLSEGKRQIVDTAISESVQEILFILFKKGYCRTDAREVIRKALAHKDIWDNKHIKEMWQFGKHDFDIYFAFKELNDDIIYANADIEAEVSRVREYQEQDYDAILNILNETPKKFGCSAGCLSYWDYWKMYSDDKSLDDLIENLAYSIMSLWYHRYKYSEIWGKIRV